VAVQGASLPVTLAPVRTGSHRVCSCEACANEHLPPIIITTSSPLSLLRNCWTGSATQLYGWQCRRYRQPGRLVNSDAAVTAGPAASWSGSVSVENDDASLQHRVGCRHRRQHRIIHARVHPATPRRLARSESKHFPSRATQRSIASAVLSPQALSRKHSARQKRLQTRRQCQRPPQHCRQPCVRRAYDRQLLTTHSISVH
jgi:hypothetical protein